MVDGRATSGVNDDILPAQLACASFGQGHLDGFRPDKTSRTHDQFRPGLFVDVEMHIDQASDHLAFAVAHDRHVDARVLLADAEFFAPVEKRGDLRAVNDVLARQAGDVGTGTADPFALNNNGPLPFPGQGPGEILAALAAAKYN